MLSVQALQETPFSYFPSFLWPPWQMKFQCSPHLPFTLRKTWLTEAPHHGQWMQLGFSFWKENAIKQRVVQRMFYLENVRQIMSGKSYRKWQEWSLVKTAVLKKEFDSNPNLCRAKRNPDWEFNRQQCRSERKELDSACFKVWAGKKLAANFNFGRMGDRLILCLNCV